MAPALILLSPLQVETVTKIIIKMRPLSTDRATLIWGYFYLLCAEAHNRECIDFEHMFLCAFALDSVVVVTAYNWKVTILIRAIHLACNPLGES